MSSLDDYPLSRSPIGELTLATARLHLRPLAACDRDDFIHMERVSITHLAPWEPTPRAGVDPGEWFERWLARSEEARTLGLGLSFAATLRSGPGQGRLVGLFSLNNLVRGVYQNADAGWRVSAEFIGRGLGSEGVTGLLDLAFGPLNLHRVQANIQSSNVASLKVAQKCGFRSEGLSRSTLHIAGRWCDHVMHAKLVGEHPARASPI